MQRSEINTFVSAIGSTHPGAACAANPDRACSLGSAEQYPDRSGLSEILVVRRCQVCGIGITFPQIDDVSSLYDGRATQDFQPLSTGLARLIKSFVFTQEARKLCRQLPKLPKRVLDFGCGSGLFTRALGTSLSNSQVYGSDFHNDAPPELSDRLYIPASQVSKFGPFDLIMAMHVLEHDNDPANLLRHLRTMGTDDSNFVFEVPNIDCVWANVFGKHWDAWYLPYHRIHFSKKSFESMVSKSGFSIIQILDVSVPSMGRSVANVLGMKNTLPLLILGAILHPIQWLGEKISRSPSAFRIIAKAA